MFWKADQGQGLAVADGGGKPKLTVELLPQGAAWGCGGMVQLHGAHHHSPFALLLTTADPRFSLQSGRARGCLPSDGGALIPSPPHPGAGAAACC